MRRARRALRASARPTGASTPARPRSRRARTTSTRPGARRTRPGRDRERPRVVILGSGPNRIGQGIEFDYCCVHAVQARSRARLRDGDGQLQPGDRLDRLRHLRPPLLRAAAGRGGARDLRPRAARGRRDPVRRPDAAQARARARGGGLPILGTPYEAVDLAEDRERFGGSLRPARHRRPRLGHGRRPGRGRRRRRGDRLPGARAAVVRPRRAADAGLLRARATSPSARRRPRAACSSTASSRAPSRSTWTRSATGRTRTSRRSCSTSRRPASTRATPPACSRRVGLPGRGARRGASTRSPARARARRRRAHQRPARAARTGASSCSRRTRARRARCPSRARRSASTSSRPRAASPPASGSRDVGLRRREPPAHVSVKAAVFPFARFPGADAVLGPGDALDRRGDGERGATSRPPSPRPSGPPGGRCPGSGTAFLSVRDGDKPAAVVLAQQPRRARLLRSAPRPAPRRRWRRPGSRSRASARSRRRATGRPSSTSSAAAALRPRRQHAGRARRALGRLPHPRGGARSRASRASRPWPAPPRPSRRSPARAAARRSPSRNVSPSTA